MNKWGIWEEQVLRDNSTKDIWLAPEEIGALLGRSAKQVSDKRVRIGLVPTEEQRKANAVIRDKVCKGCGEPFQTYREDKKFCTEECYNLWQKTHRSQKSFDHICEREGCGKHFTSRRSDTKYCSVECAFHRKRPDLAKRNKVRAKHEGLVPTAISVSKEIDEFLKTKVKDRTKSRYICGLIEADMKK